jgi:hypothetical protein
MIPIEIINQILAFVADLNNATIITQYDAITNRECYKINFHSNSLWRIKSTLVMKRHYPVYTYHLNGDYSNQYSGFNNKQTIQLYKQGIPHYEDELRNDTS